MPGYVKDFIGVYEGFHVGGSVAVLLAGYYEEDPFAAIGQSATKDVLSDQWISMRKLDVRQQGGYQLGLVRRIH